MGYTDHQQYMAAVNDFNGKKGTFESKGHVIDYLVGTRAFDMNQISVMARGWERDYRSGTLSSGTDGGSVVSAGTDSGTVVPTGGASGNTVPYKNKYEIVGALQKQSFDTETDMMQWLYQNNKVGNGDPLTDDEISALVKEYAPNYVKNYVKETSSSGEGGGEEKAESDEDLKARFVDLSSELQSANNLLGAKGYEEYLKSYGVDSQKAYAESVRTANDAYYRALTSYGKSGESLAGAGLVGSGVSDYGGHTAWAARQGAVATAGAVKQAADIENAKNYTEYLQNYRAQAAAENTVQQERNTTAINNAMAMEMTDANEIKMYLASTGSFTDEALEYISTTMADHFTKKKVEADAAAEEEKAAAEEGVSNTAKTSIIDWVLENAVTDLELAAQRAVDADAYATMDEARAALKVYVDAMQKMVDEVDTKVATDQFKVDVENATTAYEDLLAKGYAPEAARAKLSTSYDATVLDEVQKSFTDMEDAQVQAFIRQFETSLANLKGDDGEYKGDRLVSVSDTMATLNEVKDRMPEEQYNEIVASIQENNIKYLNRLCDMAYSPHNWKDACNELKITVEDPDNAEAGSEAALKALGEQVFDSVRSGDISVDLAQQWFGKNFEYDYEKMMEDKDNTKEIVTVLEKYKDFANRLGDSALYEQIIQEVAKDFSVTQGGALFLVKGPNRGSISIWFGTEAVSGNLPYLKTVEQADTDKQYALAVDRVGNMYIKDNYIKDEEEGRGWRKITIVRPTDRNDSQEQVEILFDIVKKSITDMAGKISFKESRLG